MKGINVIINFKPIFTCKTRHVQQSLILTIWTIIVHMAKGVCFLAQHVKEEKSQFPAVKNIFQVKNEYTTTMSLL